MEDQLIQDVRELRVVLQENAVSRRVEDDILVDLLLNQTGNQDRMGNVLSQLEDILDMKLPRIKVLPQLPQAPAHNHAAKNNKAGTKRGPSAEPTVAQPPPVPGPSKTKHRKTEPQTSKAEVVPQLETAQTINARLINAIYNINPIYAAFKAAELALTKSPYEALNRFVEEMASNHQLWVTSEMKWEPPAVLGDNHFQLFQSIKSKFIESKAQFLISSLPHVQPAYLERIAKDLNGNDQRLQGFIVEVCEGNRVVPLIEEGKQYKDIVRDFFTVEEFLEMYEDPLNHFKNDSRITREHYQNQALTQLKIDFRFTSVAMIKKTFRENKFHYTPTYLKLNELKKFKDRKTRRGDDECFGDKAVDEFLLQEIAFVRIKDDIDSYFRSKEKMYQDQVELARAAGKLMDCPICCEEELIELDMIRCPNGHGVCRQCVRKQSEEMIGVMKNHVFCLDPTCGTEYSLKDLKAVLPKTSYKHLEKRLQAEEILAANIEGLESCPFCEYCEVPPDRVLVFHCKNPGCCKVSCRKCRELDHGQLRCEENAMKQKLATYVESKMTEALVRECPNCKRKFVKIDGCNKMICVCGAMSCYICRAQIKDYNHFYNGNQHALQGSKDPTLCPLYSDTKKMHEEEVAKGAAQAKADLALQNPNIRVDLLLEKLK